MLKLWITRFSYTRAATCNKQKSCTSSFCKAIPMIRPYFDSGQIDGLVNGLVDAKIYERRYDRPGLAQTYWDSFSIGMLVAEILIIIGALWGALDGWRSRTGRESK